MDGQRGQWFNSMSMGTMSFDNRPMVLVLSNMSKSQHFMKKLMKYGINVSSTQRVHITVIMSSYSWVVRTSTKRWRIFYNQKTSDRMGCLSLRSTMDLNILAAEKYNAENGGFKQTNGKAMNSLGQFDDIATACEARYPAGHRLLEQSKYT